MKLSKIFIFASPIILLVFGVKAVGSQYLPADLFNDPRFMIVDEESGRLFALNNKSQDLAVLDVKSRSLIQKIKLEAGDSGTMARNSQTGKIYISHIGANKISVIEEEKIGKDDYRPTVIKEIKSPRLLAVDENKNLIYALSSLGRDIYVIDGSRNVLVNSWQIDFGVSEIVPYFEVGKIYLLFAKEGIGLLDLENGKISHLVKSGSYSVGEVDKKHNRVYFLYPAANLLTVIDGFSDGVLRHIPIDFPHSIVVNPEANRVYVSCFINGNVAIIDGKNLSVVKILSLGSGAYPGKILINYSAGKFYIPNTGLNKITIVDIKSNQIIKEVESGGRNPGKGVVNLRTGEVYFLHPESNNLVVIDSTTDSVVALLPAEAAVGGPIFGRPNNLYIDYDKDLLYVLNNLSGALTVIDEKTNKPVMAGIKIGTNPRTIAFFKNKLYVTVADEDLIKVLDRNSFDLIKTIKVGDKPRGIAVHPKNRNKVYVVNYNSGSLTIIDGKTDSVVKEIKLSEKVMPRIQISESTGRVYIPDIASSTRVFVIDGDKDEAIKEITVPDLSGGLSGFWTASVGAKIYVYSSDKGEFVVIDENNYNIIGRISLQPYAVVSPSSRQKLLYVGREDGSINVFSEPEGELIKTIQVGTSVRINSISLLTLPNNEGERLLVLDRRNGYLYIYDAGDKDYNLISSLPVGREALGPFLNRENGKIYIVNAQSDSMSVFDGKEGKLLALITNQTPLAHFKPIKPVAARIYYYLVAVLMVLGVIIFFIFRSKRTKNSAVAS